MTFNCFLITFRVISNAYTSLKITIAVVALFRCCHRSHCSCFRYSIFFVPFLRATIQFSSLLRLILRELIHSEFFMLGLFCTDCAIFDRTVCSTSMSSEFCSCALAANIRFGFVSKEHSVHAKANAAHSPLVLWS